MTTFRAFFVKMLTDHGLWPEEAEKIMDEVEVDPANEAMKGRWTDDIAGYPLQMQAVGKMSVWHTAKNWLEKNKPMHWARPMFDPDLMKEIEKATEDEK